MSDLETQLREAFANGLNEIVIRVGRYDADCKTPASFQAIAKHRDQRGGPWGVGVLTNPVSAARRALDGARPPKEPPKQEDVFG